MLLCFKERETKTTKPMTSCIHFASASLWSEGVIEQSKTGPLNLHDLSHEQTGTPCFIDTEAIFK